jgi:hypothetical protein
VLRLAKVMVVAAMLASALSMGTAYAAGEVGWTSWISRPGVTSWAYCDYYPDYYGNDGYWCYLEDQGIWKSVDPSWQPGHGFSPGEFPD